MSYKVMIVDDESIIRFGLSSCVNWEDEGLTLVGEAANGQAALSMIQDQAIDILVTDIRMPLMDGLELTRQVKDILPNVKVILISSYSDFEFAREAVKLGVVVDYLLKPTMEPDDLVRILHNCKQRLDAEEVRYQKEERFEHEEHKLRLIQFETKLKGYLAGTMAGIDWKPDWLLGPLVIAVWRYEGVTHHTDLSKILLLETVKDQLNMWCPHGISFVSGNDEIVTLLADHHGSAMTDIRSYHHRMVMEGERRFTVGISPAFHSFKSVRDAREWAVLALDSSFFHGKGKCYLGKIPAHIHDELTDIQEELQLQKKGLREKFSRSFASSDKDLCMDIFEQYVLLWNRHNAARQDIILEARNLIIMIGSQHFKHQTEEAMQSMLTKLTTIENSPTFESLITFMRKELQRLWEPDQLLIVTDDVSGAHIIQLALSYIQENYRRAISLQEVADYVHMSKNYFSEQFKKRTGFNFIDFVIRLRIHYAKHLLETTSLKIFDIGVQSGFNSPKHFLKLFKRMVHTTPGDYRDQQAKRRADENEIREGLS
jgi:two-component system response regulator YesN